jgi:hypothetical protein
MPDSTHGSENCNGQSAQEFPAIDTQSPDAIEGLEPVGIARYGLRRLLGGVAA